MPEEVTAIRDALKGRERNLRVLAKTTLASADWHATQPGDRTEAIAQARLFAARYAIDADHCASAWALFDGIEHGARIEAMASPEEEAAHEAESWAPKDDPDTVRAFAAQTDEQIVEMAGRALGRTITEEEARNLRAVALATLEEEVSPDAVV